MPPKSPLFLVDKQGKLVQMNPSAPVNEDELQILIAEHPALVSGDNDPLLLIEREHGVADAAGSARWSLDHLFVTRSAVPVLIEVKRAGDTRLRREVVGQMMDYAANSVAYWPKGTIEARFQQSCLATQDQNDPDVRLAAFLGADTDPAQFWEQVDANFIAGNIKLIFVADEIPSELARIVEFLNDQMTAEVRAIELRYFEGEGVRTLSPRVIGETERSRLQKSGNRSKLAPLLPDQWLTTHIAPQGTQCMAGAKLLLKVIEEAKAEYGVASTQGSIYACITSPSSKNSYPFFLTKQGKCQLGFGWITAAPALEPLEIRQAFYNRFKEAVGDLSNENYKTGFPSFPLEKLADPQCAERFRKVARDFMDACRTDK